MKQINGWHLPGKDGYFTRFVEGGPRKSNGFQREHLELALSHVKEFGVAIDVGAHVGFWTLDLAAKFEEVYAFEPAPDTFECLVKNTEGHKNVTICNVAVGEKPGPCDIIEDAGRKGNTGARYCMPGGGPFTMIALDDLNFMGCDLLKIDVEGFEAAVIGGARKLIRTYQPVIIMESDKQFRDRYNFRNKQAVLEVLELGYVEDKHVGPDPDHPKRMRNLIRPDRIFIPESYGV